MQMDVGILVLVKEWAKVEVDHEMSLSESINSIGLLKLRDSQNLSE